MGAWPMCVAYAFLTWLQAVISASFAASKPAAGADRDDADDDPKKRPRRRRQQQPAPPQSLAPWHTLPYMGREVGLSSAWCHATTSDWCAAIIID